MKRLFKYALTIAAMSGLMAAPVFGQTEIHVLDVGQGLSVLVESQSKVDSLDYVIASHYDADHLNGVVGALNVFPVKQVFSPDYTTDTRVFNSFHSVIDTKSIDRKQPKVGAVYQ